MDILLSAVEVVRRDPEDLEGCETLIVANYQRNNWLKVGAALLVIHDTALFKKSGADSFSNYISTKADFGFGPRQALRLLAATKLAKIFPPTIALPTSERQARGVASSREPARPWPMGAFGSISAIKLAVQLSGSNLNTKRIIYVQALRALCPSASSVFKHREQLSGSGTPLLRFFHHTQPYSDSYPITSPACSVPPAWQSTHLLTHQPGVRVNTFRTRKVPFRLLRFHNVYENRTRCGPAVPSSQVRALVGLEPRKAIKTWVKANLISQETGVPLTHRLVESVLSKNIPESYRAACADWCDFVSPDSEFYRTPYHIVAGVKQLYSGVIDLDPCSDELAQVWRVNADNERERPPNALFAIVTVSRCCPGMVQGNH